jgi:ATP-dependent 26S proteasome regulatory subunit
MSLMDLMAVNPELVNFLALMTDKSKSMKARVRLLVQAVVAHHGDGEALEKLLAPVLDHAAGWQELVEAAQVKQKYEQAVRELTDGPLREGTFLRLEASRFGAAKVRARVVFSDGQRRPVAIAEHVDQRQLTPGATVYVDPKGAILMDVADRLPDTGQVARFLRLLDDGRAEVAVRDEPLVLTLSQELADMAAAGELPHGSQVTFCPQRQFAFKKLPAAADRKHRFVDAGKIAEVVASRDIGKPHWILKHLLFRLHVMLHRPDLMTRFRLRPRVSVLLVGPSGVGKTLTIQAFLYEFYRQLREFAGRDVGSRVLRAKSSTLLSEWLGQSDKAIDSLFDDLIHVASQEFELPDGRKTRLPVALLLEEVEGLGKRRGSDVSDAYDRILGILLQRLDDPTDTLSSLPIFIISSSNRPELIDSALVRRLGGVKALFRRLDSAGFSAVLGKKIWPEFPCASRNGTPQEQLRGQLIQQVTATLFSPNGDGAGQVEITLRDGAKLVKHRRDFLTGATVEQAVANAIDRLAYDASCNGSHDCGLSAAEIVESLYEVVDSLIENLTPFNAGDYVDLPEQSAVAHVRRLPPGNGRLSHMVM